MNYKKIFPCLSVNSKVISKIAFKICSSIFSLYTILLSFVTWENIGEYSTQNRLLLLVATILFSLVSACIYVLIKRSRTVWEKGSGKIISMYGDLLKIAFPKKVKDTSIVVIPVNTHFDTIVDEDLSFNEKPLISPNSIHGRWLKMILMNSAEDELNKHIANSLKLQRIQPHEDTQRMRGNQLRYPVGSIAIVPGNNDVIFFLLALTEFDSNNNAQCNDENFILALRELINVYNRYGQGYPMYLPLMGTNLSRYCVSHEDALHKIVSILELEREKIHGSISVVVYNQERDKVSIWQ